MQLRVQDLDLAVGLDVARRDFALARGLDVDGLGLVAVQRAMMRLMLRTISVTSSFTPGMVENSCWMPDILMLVTAVPGRRGQEHPTERVAQSRAVAALQGSITYLP